MKKKQIGLVLTAALLVVAGVLSAFVFTGKQALTSVSAEQPLEHILARVPAETFEWDYLSFADYEGVQGPLEISAGFEPLTSKYFQEESISSSMGFPPASVHQSMTIGTPPLFHAWLKGQFDSEPVKAAFSRHGYLPISSAPDDLPLWGLEGDFSAGLEFNKEKTDPFFLFGGQFGQRWPVAFDDSLIVSSRNEQAMRAVAAGKGPMLSEDPRMQALLKALASQPVKQLVLVQADKVLPLMTEPMCLIAVAQAEARNKTTVLLGVEYADLVSAQAAEKRLKQSLPNAMLKAKVMPLSELLKSYNGRQMALRTEEGHDGKAWLVIPFQFDKPREMDPFKYRSPFQLFMDLMNRMDMEWLQE